MGTCSTYNSTALAAFSAAEVVRLTTPDEEGFCPVDCILKEITRKKEALTQDKIDQLLSHSQDQHRFSERCGLQCLRFVNEDPEGTGGFVEGKTREHNGFVTVEWRMNILMDVPLFFAISVSKTQPQDCLWQRISPPDITKMAFV